MTTTVIYRKADLSVSFSIHLLNEHLKGQYEGYPTENITVPDEKMKLLKGNILIVGGFYKDLNLFNPEAHITVFLNNADVIKEDDYKHIKFIRADKDVGFLSSFVLPKIKEIVTDGKSIVKIDNFCSNLDDYMYGIASKAALYFKNGIYMHDGQTLLEKLLDAYENTPLFHIPWKGEELYKQNQHIVEKRYKEGKYINVEYKGKEYKAFVSYGDTAIIETLLHMLEKAQIDIAILLRYNLKENKTFISLRTTDKLIAGHLAHELYKGGGSEYMAGASVDGILIL